MKTFEQFRAYARERGNRLPDRELRAAFEEARRYAAPSHDAFLDAAYANPHDSAPWLVWSDLLNEQGHDRLAALIRHNVALHAAQRAWHQQLKDNPPGSVNPADSPHARDILAHEKALAALHGQSTPEESELAYHIYEGRNSRPMQGPGGVPSGSLADKVADSVAYHAIPPEEPRSWKSARRDKAARYAARSAADTRKLAQDLLQSLDPGKTPWHKALFYAALKRTGSMADAIDLLRLVVAEMPAGYLEAKKLAARMAKGEKVVKQAANAPERAAKVARQGEPAPVKPKAARQSPA